MKTRKLGKLSLILAALVLGLGYAAVTTTLNISGTATVGSSTFEVVFDGTSLGGTNVPTKSVSTDGSTLTFKTGKLKDIGDTATVTYKIANNSQYGATVENVTCTSTDPDYSYITVTTPGQVVLAKGETSEEQTITVKLSKSYAEEDDKEISFTCSMTATASSAA